MDKRIWVGAGLGVVLMAGVAAAQAPAAPGGTPPAPPLSGPGAAEQHDGHRGPPGGPMMGRGEDGRPGMGRHMEWMRHMMEMHRPPESKAAHFRLRKGDATVDIKCADDEPTKACVDAATALLGALPK